MEDQNKGNENLQPSEAASDELTPQEQENISAGWGDIKGGSTDDKHKDWSEITGFSQGMTQP